MAKLRPAPLSRLKSKSCGSVKIVLSPLFRYCSVTLLNVLLLLLLCFEINFSGRQRGFDGVLYNL